MPNNFKKHLFGIYKTLKAQIDLINSSIGHTATQGGENEEAIRELLKGCLPKIYGIGSGMILGTDGEISKQIDIIVYDATRPNFAVGQDSKIFLADHVLAAIEIKTTYTSGGGSTLSDALKNIASVKELKVAPMTWFEQHVDEVSGEITSRKYSPTPPLGIVFFFGAPQTQGGFDCASFFSTVKTQIDQFDPHLQPDLLLSLDHAFVFEHKETYPPNRTSSSQRFSLVVVQATDNDEPLHVTGIDTVTKGILNLTGFELTDGSTPGSTILVNSSSTSKVAVITQGREFDLDPLAYRVGYWDSHFFLLDSFRAFLFFFYILDSLLRIKRPNRMWSLKDYFGSSFAMAQQLPFPQNQTTLS